MTAARNSRISILTQRFMKYLLPLLLLVLATVQPINAKGADPVKYDIMSAGSGVQGTYLVKVYVYAKSGKVSDQQLMYAAVHGVLFRGFQGKPSAPALAGQPVVEEQKADYFTAFFAEKGGAYQSYASIVPGSYERIKTGKGYKVGAIVQVKKDQLRSDLSSAGIIRGLTDGF